MKHLSSKIFLGLAIVTLAGFSASAQEFKVGVVNLDRIFREANSAKAAQTKLEQEFSKREKELNDLATQLKTLSDKFEREAPTLPKASEPRGKSNWWTRTGISSASAASSRKT
jgi:outer membrane protein